MASHYDEGYPGYYGQHGYGGGIGASVQMVQGSQNSTEERYERGRQLVDMIINTVEPTAWLQNGGDWASIEYRDTVLLPVFATKMSCRFGLSVAQQTAV